MEYGYLVDTNTVIDYLGKRLPDPAIEFLKRLTIQLSVISRIELLAWQHADNDQVKVLSDFIAVSIVFDLNENIILKAIEIRKDYRLKLPDAVIAATAVVNNLTLVTRNIADFRKVDELTFINPHLI